MSSEPFVSVVVTCYNYGQYVAECLASIQAQTYQNYEVIVVDDGSTDHSEEQIRPFLDDDRFRYIKQRNSGQAKAKNLGIQESRGKLVAFLDADDCWVSDKLVNQIPLFGDSEVGVVYSQSIIIDEVGNVVKYPPKRKSLFPQRGYVSNYLFMDNFIPFSSTIVRKKCFTDFGLFDETLSMGIDWDLWLKVSTKYKFDYCEEKLLKYRIGHSGQMSKNIELRNICGDIIMKSFLSRFPLQVDSKCIKNAYYITYCRRGYYYRSNDINKCLKNYFCAIQIKPFSVNAYKGIFKSLLIFLF